MFSTKTNIVNKKIIKLYIDFIQINNSGNIIDNYLNNINNSTNDYEFKIDRIKKNLSKNISHKKSFKLLKDDKITDHIFIDAINEILPCNISSNSKKYRNHNNSIYCQYEDGHHRQKIKYNSVLNNDEVDFIDKLNNNSTNFTKNIYYTDYITKPKKIWKLFHENEINYDNKKIYVNHYCPIFHKNLKNDKEKLKLKLFYIFSKN